MKKTATSSLFSCLLFVVALLFAHTEASAQINGQNVKAVKYSKAEEVQGFFTQLTGKTWTQVTPQSVKDGFWSEGTTAAEWTETHRDKWSVYLRAANDGARIQIDLWKKKVTLSQGGGKTELAESLEPFTEPISLAQIAEQTQEPETVVQGTVTVTTPVVEPPAAKVCPKGQELNGQGECVTVVIGQVDLGACPEGYYRQPAWTGPCVIDVFFYSEPGLSLAAAQSISDERGWVVATAEQVELAWKNLGLDRYAFGRVADGRFALPVQTDQPGFAAGANIGASGGNQGFFYVKKPQAEAAEVTTEPAAPTTPSAPETRTILVLDPVTGERRELVVNVDDAATPGSIYNCNYISYSSNFSKEPDPRENWMVDMWEDPVSTNSNSLLVEAAVKLLENRGVAVTDAALQRLSTDVKSDPVTRYEFAPFMLGTFFDALVTDQPRVEQSDFRSYFEQFQTCHNLKRAQILIQLWNQYQNPGQQANSPNTLSVINFNPGPLVSGFAQSDPVEFGPKGGAAVAQLYLPVAAESGLMQDSPMLAAVGSLSDDLVGVMVGAGLGTGVATIGGVIGTATAFISAQGSAIAARAVASIGQAVGRAAEKTLLSLASQHIATTLAGPIIVAVSAAMILGSVVAEVVGKAAYEQSLRDKVTNPGFSVNEFVNVPEDQRETKRGALFTLLVKHLIATPVEHRGLTLEMPVVPGEYQIRLGAAGRYVNVNPNDPGEFLSVATEPTETSGNFILERLRDDNYRIWVRSSGKFLRVNSDGYPYISTREQIADEFSMFRFRLMPDSTYRVVSAANGKFVHVDIGSDAQWAETQLQSDDGYAHFALQLFDLEPNTLEPMGGNEFDRIQSAVYPHGYIHNQNGKLELGKAEPNWWSAMWKFVDAGGGYVRIQNRWYPNLHLHYQNGKLELGEIQSGWYSAMWKLVDAGGGYVKIQSRWYDHDYLYVEDGVVTVGRVDPDSRSAMWRVE